MVSFPDPRARHPYHMHDMIRAQPAFLRETRGILEATDAARFLRKPRRLVLTGCGTSYHAALFGARVLQRALGHAAVVEAVHAYDLPREERDFRRTTVLGVSHSGATPTTNAALQRARRRGARVLGLSGLSASPLEKVADDVLVIGSAHDRSWANTMSYTTQLMAFAGLAVQMGGPAWRRVLRSWRAVPGTAERALGTEASIRRLAKRVVSRERVTFLGGGLDEITCLEAALKIRETCSMPAVGYHLEQFLHGPLEGLDRRDAVVALLAQEDGARGDAILHACAATRAYVGKIGAGPAVDARLPRLPEVLRPIVTVIPLQFLAYYAALARKTNPDVMRTDRKEYRPAVELLFT
ncbi:MAG: hypothetical protein A3K68_03865 [Euryarchaeota archaeon RBG_16_68_13]|nr:MAG: hypothetical protein A3K68_03865 [Euryarchaeota archaeon RBG_16_68_13]